MEVTIIIDSLLASVIEAVLKQLGVKTHLRHTVTDKDGKPTENTHYTPFTVSPLPAQNVLFAIALL